MNIHVQLMGSLRIHYPSHTCATFRSRRVAAMLGYLITQRCPVSRSTLADLFWPDKPSSTARVNVRWAISCLRHYVPGCWVVTRSTVAFCPPKHCTIDIYQLEDALHAQDISALAGIVPEIRGEFLAGLVLDDLPELNLWLLAEQARWATVLFQAFVSLAEDAFVQGDAAAAVYWLEEASGRFPWEERIHQLLMYIFVSMGHPHKALVQYELCRHILATNLDSAPDSSTQRLYKRIRSLFEDVGGVGRIRPASNTQPAR